ncbi:hypothetical protein GCM10010309_73050 [Streptomyces violaceochromogenes]|nr:hypothetical protein GCM10010309_73050 [Streptomyces violaceochromogenes]
MSSRSGRLWPSEVRVVRSRHRARAPSRRVSAGAQRPPERGVLSWPLSGPVCAAQPHDRLLRLDPPHDQERQRRLFLITWVAITLTSRRLTRKPTRRRDTATPAAVAVAA